ncbi:MAG: hypothetical protein H7831_01090 [Magnetococcus sp. WYHC-3]
MKAQRINLYQEQFHPPVEVVSGLLVILAALGALGATLVVAGVEAWRWHDHEMQRVATLAERDAAKLKADDLDKKYPVIEKDERLEERITQLELEVDLKKRRLDLLAGFSHGTTKGFGAQFAGLSQAHVNGLWLSDIRFYAGGEHLYLEGQASNRQLVADLVDRLREQDAFSGKILRVFDLSLEVPEDDSKDKERQGDDAKAKPADPVTAQEPQPVLRFRLGTDVEDKEAFEASSPEDQNEAIRKKLLGNLSEYR